MHAFDVPTTRSAAVLLSMRCRSWALTRHRGGDDCSELSRRFDKVRIGKRLLVPLPTEGIGGIAFIKRTTLALDQALRPESFRRAQEARLVRADRDRIRVTSTGSQVPDALIEDMVA